MALNPVLRCGDRLRVISVSLYQWLPRWWSRSRYKMSPPMPQLFHSKKNSIPCKIYPQEFKSRFVVFFKCLCCLSLWWGDDGLFLPQVPLARTWCASWDKKEILIFHCKDNTNDWSGLTDLCCNRYIITKTVSLLLFCRRRPVVASFFKLK